MCYWLQFHPATSLVNTQLQSKEFRKVSGCRGRLKKLLRFSPTGPVQLGAVTLGRMDLWAAATSTFKCFWRRMRRRLNHPDSLKNVFPPRFGGTKAAFAWLSAANGLTQRPGDRCLLSQTHFICKRVVTSRPPLTLWELVGYFQENQLFNTGALWWSAVRAETCQPVCFWRVLGYSTLTAVSASSFCSSSSSFSSMQCDGLCLLPRSSSVGPWHKYFRLVSDLLTRIEEDLGLKKQKNDELNTFGPLISSVCL